jgi:hypothetical protein
MVCGRGRGGNQDRVKTIKKYDVCGRSPPVWLVEWFRGGCPQGIFVSNVGIFDRRPDCEIHRRVVRNWFYNRRQREKKIKKEIKKD